MYDFVEPINHAWPQAESYQSLSSADAHHSHNFEPG